jgi:hypothetical protein
MVAVVIAVVAVVGLVAVVVAVIALRRRSSDEIHSVEGYRQTLDTLHELQSRSGSVRLVGSTGPPPGRASSIAAEEDRPVDEVTGLRRVGGTPLRFDDQRPPASRADRATLRQRDRAIASMNHRPRRVGALLLAALVGVAIVGGLFLAGHRHHPQAAATTTTAPAHGSATTAGSATTVGHVTTTTAHHGHPKATTTTAPTSFTAATSTANSALYVPPATSYTLTFIATTGQCWIQATSTASGSNLYVGVLSQGSSQTVNATGVTKVTIGAPSAFSAALDGVPVVMPSSLGSPFVLTFQPAGAAPSTASSSGTTTTVAP